MNQNEQNTDILSGTDNPGTLGHYCFLISNFSKNKKGTRKKEEKNTKYIESLE